MEPRAAAGPEAGPEQGREAEAARAKEREERERLRKERSGGSSGRGSSSKSKNRPRPSEEELAAARQSVAGLFRTIKTLRDPEATVEQKKKATTDYLIESGELLAYKYLWMLYEYSEEVNFGAACILWAAYRGYRFFKGPVALADIKIPDGQGENLFEKLAAKDAA